MGSQGRGSGGGRGGVGSQGRGRVIPVSDVVSVPYTNSVCVGMEVSCKPS